MNIYGFVSGTVFIHPNKKTCPLYDIDPEGNEQWHRECEMVELADFGVPDVVANWFVDLAADMKQAREMNDDFEWGDDDDGE